MTSGAVGMVGCVAFISGNSTTCGLSADELADLKQIAIWVAEESPDFVTVVDGFGQELSPAIAEARSNQTGPCPA